jgi:C-terminal peptidase prc
MTAWATIRRVGIGAAFAVLLVFTSPARGDDTRSEKPTVSQLRAAAEAAEKAGDWETAFTAYCHLFVADRGSREVREKLNVALRRTQQLRRHRDPQFQQYAANVSVADTMKLFGEVLTKVPVLYVDRDRATPQVLWENGIEELSRALADPVFREVFLDGPSPAKVEGFRTALKVSWAKQTIATAADGKIQLRRLLNKVQEEFPVRVPSALVLEVVCGSCGGLDEYTVFLNPAQFHPESLSAVPDLTAQGIYLGFEDGSLLIAGIAPGSWVAFHAPHLQKGDRVLRVNGRGTEMATPAAVADALRFPVQGFHEIMTEPADPTKAAVTTQLPVIVPTVYGTALVPMKEGVGYMRIGSITPATPRELDEALASLKARGVRAVVIDLRGNMGGSFLAAVDTAKRLIPAGLIVTTQGQISQVDNRPFSSDSGMTAHDIPAVVIVDAETASAAEVFAAALKDHERATLVGMPTFGKGAIQYPLRLDSLDEKDARGNPKTSKSGGVRLTIAKLIAPRGGAINGIGITPHILEADSARQVQVAAEKAAELVQTLPPPMPSPTGPPVLP